MGHNDFDWLHVLCQDMNRARSLTVSLLVKYCEWDQLVNLRCYPSDYFTSRFFKGIGQSIDDFRYDYQITEILRKNADLPLTSDRVQNAKDKFLEAEQLCKVTNAKLRGLSMQMSLGFTTFDPRWGDFVNAWRIEMDRLLGPIPDTLDVKFSSGSTFDDRHMLVPQNKMSSRPTVTEQAWAIIQPFWEDTLWCRGLVLDYPNRSLPKFISGNRFTTVPKDAVTDRGICVEPSLNVTHQLSVGKVIRKRLRHRGIDLKYGQPVHQRLAEQASLKLDAGTIDLSSASDTISKELVKLVLPGDWFDLLDTLRSPMTRFDGSWILNEKFSSMGNGFTFELETALFYTLALTVAKSLRHDVKCLKVYGDDIIVDSAIAHSVMGALRFFGFKTNDRKTFVEGIPFRESCGGDYYLGTPVRGHYLETNPKEPIDWIALSNGIRRMACADLDAFGDLGVYKRAWLRVISRLPTHIRSCRGPEVYGNCVIHDSPQAIGRTTWSGEYTLKGYFPVFADDCHTHYDRRTFTRDSVVAAGILGLISDPGGDTARRATRQVIPNSEAAGYTVRVFKHTSGGVLVENVDKLIDSLNIRFRPKSPGLTKAR